MMEAGPEKKPSPNKPSPEPKPEPKPSPESSKNNSAGDKAATKGAHSAGGQVKAAEISVHGKADRAQSATDQAKSAPENKNKGQHVKQKQSRGRNA
ncbi:MAG: hypothetical protein M0Z78_08745 [Betaproteobacteria bacterium]|nr:hypothetical protein [Betaproteobacteria bacterium]